MEDLLPDTSHCSQPEPEPAPDMRTPAYLDSYKLYPEIEGGQYPHCDSPQLHELGRPPTKTANPTALPDLSIDSINDLAATFMALNAINRSLIDVPTRYLRHKVILLTKQSTNNPTLDIGSSNISAHLPHGSPLQ